MKSIKSTNYYVHFEAQSYIALHQYLEENFHSKIFILVDSNTQKYCLPNFISNVGNSVNFEVICVPAGEIYKNLETCTSIWNELSNLGADRKSLLINLGGGVITDMGGFVASCFKRGISFINIPTTLLSMVDASVGGKTGVDLGVVKNQIGLFSNPEMVLIDTGFLNTVSEREKKSGVAEIIKYGFTFDEDIWNLIKKSKQTYANHYDTLVHRSVEIKNNVVLQDLHENNLRKALNFGHTIGHAIESYFLESKDKNNLTHGEAIAIGMVIEMYFSSKLLNFPIEKTKELKQFVIDFYGKTIVEEKDIVPIIDLMKFDKKNVSGKVNFVLLENMEKCILDLTVSNSLLLEGFAFYAE